MGMDQNMAKQLRPLDFRGKAGTMLRGNNVYPGGMPNATAGRLPKRKKTVVPNKTAIQNYLVRK
jgi:hypothetical protein